MEATNFPITHWSEDDKPREKMMLKGKSALSDAELVAILIGSISATSHTRRPLVARLRYRFLMKSSYH